jgi:hypothetical protein
VVGGIPNSRNDESRVRADDLESTWTESSRSNVKVDADDLSEEVRNLSDEAGTGRYQVG